MAAGRASVLLIRIAGDSTGATAALNQVATASAAAAEVVENSSEDMVRATSQHIQALELEHKAEMQSIRLAKISADQAAEASREQLAASRQSLKMQQLELRAAQLAGQADQEAVRTAKQNIIATQRQIAAQQEHTAALVQNSKAAAVNVASLERLQRAEIEQAATAEKTADINAKAAKKGSVAFLGAAAAVVAACVVVTKQAMALQNATVAVTAVWGESADEMMAWSEGLAEMGLSTAQAAQASAVLGSQLMNLGIPMEEAMVWTQELILLSADMAAAFGTTVPQALTALGATFRGEYDSIEKYAVSLNAATVAAQMEAEAAAGLTFATQQAAKAHATYTLILQQTDKIQGLVTDSNITLQEAVNKLKASFSNLAGEIGGYLLPMLTPLYDALGDIFNKTSELIDENGLLATVTRQLTQIMSDLWAIIEPILIPALEALNSIFDTLADFLNTYVQPALDAISSAFNSIASAISNVIKKIQDLITWIDELWTHGAENNEAAAASAAAMAASRRYNLSRMGLQATGTAHRGLQGTGPSGNITINVQAGVGDPHAIAREIRKVLKRDDQRLGRAS